MGRHRKVPKAAIVISVIALVIALGGGAWAASKIDPDSVGGKQLKQRSVGPQQVAPETLEADKVKPDSIGGTKIDESRLGEVPSADRADSTESVDYRQPFFIGLDFGEEKPLAENGPLSLSVDCELVGGTNPTVRVLFDTTDTQTTTEGNDAYDGAGGNFVPVGAPPDDRVLEARIGPDPTSTFVGGNIDDGWIVAGDGPPKMLSITSETTMYGLNYLGHDCVVAGTVNLIG